MSLARGDITSAVEDVGVDVVFVQQLDTKVKILKEAATTGVRIQKPTGTMNVRE